MRLITENTVYDASTYDNNPDPYPDLLTNTRYNITEAPHDDISHDPGIHTMPRVAWPL